MTTCSAHASLPPKGRHAHISTKVLSGQRSPSTTRSDESPTAHRRVTNLGDQRHHGEDLHLGVPAHICAVGLYSRGNRLRLRLSFASQNQASQCESCPQGVTIPNANAGEKCYFRFSMKEFRRVSLICLLDIRRILAQAKASSLFSKPFSLAAIKMPIVPVIRSFIVVATCLARTSSTIKRSLLFSSE